MKLAVNLAMIHVVVVKEPPMSLFSCYLPFGTEFAVAKFGGMLNFGPPLAIIIILIKTTAIATVNSSI